MSRYREFGRKVYGTVSRLIAPPQPKPVHKIYEEIMTKSRNSDKEKE